MREERVLEESKNYLISVHDALRRTFRNAHPEGSALVNNILEGIKKDVEQLEILEEMINAHKSKKDKKLELIEEQ